MHGRPLFMIGKESARNGCPKENRMTVTQPDQRIPTIFQLVSEIVSMKP